MSGIECWYMIRSLSFIYSFIDPDLFRMSLFFCVSLQRQKQYISSWKKKLFICVQTYDILDDNHILVETTVGSISANIFPLSFICTHPIHVMDEPLSRNSFCCFFPIYPLFVFLFPFFPLPPLGHSSLLTAVFCFDLFTVQMKCENFHNFRHTECVFGMTENW